MTQIVDALQLADLFSTRRGAQFVTMNTCTVPDLIGGKKNPLHGRIEKRSIVNGIVNWSYERAVNAQRLREEKPLVPIMTVYNGGQSTTKQTDDISDFIGMKFDSVEMDTAVEAFESNPRQWGQRIAHTAFVRHIKELTRKISEKRVYVELKVERSLGHVYYVDDKSVDDILVNHLIRPPSESSRQGVDKKIILRDYRLSSITGIQLNGQFYGVEISDTEESALYNMLG